MQSWNSINMLKTCCHILVGQKSLVMTNPIENMLTFFIQFYLDIKEQLHRDFLDISHASRSNLLISSVLLNPVQRRFSFAQCVQQFTSFGSKPWAQVAKCGLQEKQGRIGNFQKGQERSSNIHLPHHHNLTTTVILRYLGNKVLWGSKVAKQ